MLHYLAQEEEEETKSEEAHIVECQKTSKTLFFLQHLILWATSDFASLLTVRLQVMHDLAIACNYVDNPGSSTNNHSW